MPREQYQLAKSEFTNIQELNCAYSSKKVSGQRLLASLEDILHKMSQEGQGKSSNKQNGPRTIKQMQSIIADVSKRSNELTRLINTCQADNQKLAEKVNYLRKQTLINSHQLEGLQKESREKSTQFKSLWESNRRKSDQLQALNASLFSARSRKFKQDKQYYNQVCKVKDTVRRQIQQKETRFKEEPFEKELFFFPTEPKLVEAGSSLAQEKRAQEMQELRSEEGYLNQVFAKTGSDRIDEVIEVIQKDEEETKQQYKRLQFINQQISNLDKLEAQLHRERRERETQHLRRQNPLRLQRCLDLATRLQKKIRERETLELNNQKDSEKLLKMVEAVKVLFDKLEIAQRNMRGLPPDFRGKDINQKNLALALEAIELHSNDVVLHHHDMFGEYCSFRPAKNEYNDLISQSELAQQLQKLSDETAKDLADLDRGSTLMESEPTKLDKSVPQVQLQRISEEELNQFCRQLLLRPKKNRK